MLLLIIAGLCRIAHFWQFDMAVFGVAEYNRNDEIAQYLMGRYISTNEVLWRIYSFPIHGRYPAVIHLAVHLENGQRVYFTEANVQQRAAQPLATTQTAFFELCESDEFARTLLYSDVTHYYTWTAKEWIRRKQGTPVDGHPRYYYADTMGRLYYTLFIQIMQNVIFCGCC